MKIFDNPDFYPTPENVIEQLVSIINIKGKIILEPSAGKGDIINRLIKGGSVVSYCEIVPELAIINERKARFLSHDFMSLEKEDVSHIQAIIANPPFSCANKHILKMWEIAPDGCEIITLCNHDTIKGGYENSTKKLKQLIEKNGVYIHLGQVFAEAERKTNCEIGLIHLIKPCGAHKNEFEGYFNMFDDDSSQDNGIMRYDEIRDIVNRYVSAVKMYDEVMNTNKAINELMSPINIGSISFGSYQNYRGDLRFIDRETFKKELQKSAWKIVFGKFKMDKYVTSKVKEDLNKFIEQQVNVPFTMSNIYKMIEMIVGTHASRMDQVIIDAFDKITQYYHENRFQKEGWKTNSEYMVNKKIVLPRMIRTNFSGKMDAEYSHQMDDIIKALCFVSGINYDTIDSFDNFMDNLQLNPNAPAYRQNDKQPVYRNFGELYEWGFFKLRGYKKGTLHLEFKDEKIWELFNKISCKAKGFMLASKYTSDYRKKSTSVDLFNND